MRKGHRDIKRLLLDLAEPLGAAVDIDRTHHGHLRITLTRGARRSTLFFGSTPSDVRAVKNQIAEAKRALRAIAVA
jgi:hypothetical protein